MFNLLSCAFVEPISSYATHSYISRCFLSRLGRGSAATMEYDKATSSTPILPPKLAGGTTTDVPGRGHSRVKGAGNVDTELLSQPITFQFSGRIARNRSLKNPHDRTPLPPEQ
jgi:hypothetical protein